MDPPILYTPEEVAGLLRIHVQTVYRYLREGKIRSVRIGRVYRVRAEDLEHFLEASASTGAPANTVPD